VENNKTEYTLTMKRRFPKNDLLIKVMLLNYRCFAFSGYFSIQRT